MRRRASSPAAATRARELRELANGILPSALVYGGLRAGIDALALGAQGALRRRRAGSPAASTIGCRKPHQVARMAHPIAARDHRPRHRCWSGDSTGV
jgi:hypothetical protein